METSPVAELGHPNGLQLSPPPRFLNTQTQQGFRLSEGGDLRSPRTIALELVTDLPTMQPSETRALSTGGSARFSIREVGAGSAGSEYELRAAKEIEHRWVVMTATAQSERGEPDFATAWRVLESTRLSKTE